MDDPAPSPATPDGADASGDALAPIEHSVDVPLPPEDAFRLFTEDLAAWWPIGTHSVAAGRGGRPDAVEVEPRQGGRIVETLPDGRRAEWARFTDWAPGRRLAMRWYPGRDEGEATDVVVTFTPTGTPAGIGTRVHVRHSGFECLGARVEMDCARYRAGWAHVLGTCYGGACTARAAAPA